MPVTQLTPHQVDALREVMVNLDRAKELRTWGHVEAMQAEKSARDTLRAVIAAIDQGVVDTDKVGR